MLRISIRDANPMADIPAILDVERDAFGRDDEANLVRRLYKTDAVWLSHVAELHDVIIAHALYSMVTVADDDTVYQFPALAPIAVATSYQNQGIGGRLIRHGLRITHDVGFGLMFLVGHPDYYPRFGFQPAQPLGFTSDYVEEDGPHEHFMVAVLDEALLNTVKGHVRYHSAFEGL